ncbi:hypothetical protein OPQ81_003826 [Rhizoctonia solani]|nr:hypothetical protein OPQ81_003826 [Rhizoctonia solani]
MYSIDEEGEGLDVNRIQTKTEETPELDAEDGGSGGDTLGADPSANRDEWWHEDDYDMEGDDTESDGEIEDEADDFIVDLYDL